MEFRKIRIGDAKAGREFINSLVEEGVDIGTRRKFSLSRERKWLKELRSDRSRTCLCAFDNKILAGSAEVRQGRDDVSRHVGEFGISVKKEYRGTGLAHSIARKIFALAKKRGVSILRLRVFSTNRRALRFYRKLGFRKIAVMRREIRISRRYIGAYLMEKKL